VAALQDEMVAWRRKLHAAPELSFEERETAAFVAATLRSFGIAEVVEGVGRTGVVALIRGGAGDGECIALRADMDALPLQVSARARRHAPISTPTPETPTMSTSLAAMRACAVWPITYSWREYRSSSTAGNPRASEQALHASERATRRRRADARVRVLARGSDFLLTARGSSASASGTSGSGSGGGGHGRSGVRWDWRASARQVRGRGAGRKPHNAATCAASLAARLLHTPCRYLASPSILPAPAASAI